MASPYYLVYWDKRDLTNMTGNLSGYLDSKLPGSISVLPAKGVTPKLLPE